MTPPFLETQRLTRSFGGVAAVREISLRLERGRILALIGPNGAGKSTFVNLLTGTLKPSAGEVLLEGSRITGWAQHRIVHAGIIRTFQNGRLFGRLTALENVMVGGTSGVSAGLLTALLRTGRRRSDEKSLEKRALALLERLGLGAVASANVADLPYGQQRMLEIARALMAEPRIMLLDEPAAGLNSGEADRFLVTLRALREDGLGILLIEHNMGLVMRAADRIAVLNFGQLIAEGTPAQVRAHPAVLEAYLGRGHAHG